MSENNIIHENGAFFVARAPLKGRTAYYVLENVGTHSTIRDTFDIGPAGKARAIAKCDERAYGNGSAYADRLAAVDERVDAGQPWRHP